MHLDERPDERQCRSRGLPGGGRSVPLTWVNRSKTRGDSLGRDADTVVPNPDNNPGLFKCGRRCEDPPLVGVLGGIRQEVADHLFKAGRIRHRRQGFGSQDDTQLVLLGVDERPDGVGRPGDDLIHVEAIASGAGSCPP